MSNSFMPSSGPPGQPGQPFFQPSPPEQQPSPPEQRPSPPEQQPPPPEQKPPEKPGQYSSNNWRTALIIVAIVSIVVITIISVLLGLRKKQDILTTSTVTVTVPSESDVTVTVTVPSTVTVTATVTSTVTVTVPIPAPFPEDTPIPPLPAPTKFANNYILQNNDTKEKNFIVDYWDREDGYGLVRDHIDVPVGTTVASTVFMLLPDSKTGNVELHPDLKFNIGDNLQKPVYSVVAGSRLDSGNHYFAISGWRTDTSKVAINPSDYVAVFALDNKEWTLQYEISTPSYDQLFITITEVSGKKVDYLVLIWLDLGKTMISFYLIEPTAKTKPTVNPAATHTARSPTSINSIQFVKNQIVITGLEGIHVYNRGPFIPDSPSTDGKVSNTAREEEVVSIISVPSLSQSKLLGEIQVDPQSKLVGGAFTFVSIPDTAAPEKSRLFTTVSNDSRTQFYLFAFGADHKGLWNTLPHSIFSFPPELSIIPDFNRHSVAKVGPDDVAFLFAFTVQNKEELNPEAEEGSVFIVQYNINQGADAFIQKAQSVDKINILSSPSISSYLDSSDPSNVLRRSEVLLLTANSDPTTRVYTYDIDETPTKP